MLRRWSSCCNGGVRFAKGFMLQKWNSCCKKIHFAKGFILLQRGDYCQGVPSAGGALSMQGTMPACFPQAPLPDSPMSNTVA